MSDRRTFLTRLTGALAGLVASKNVSLEAAPAKKPAVIHGTDLKIEANGQQVYPVNRKPPYADHTPRPKRVIRMTVKNTRTKTFLNVAEVEVYVDGVKARDVMWVDFNTDWDRSWVEAVVCTRMPIPGIEPDEERYDGRWLEYIYRGYRA